MRQIFINENGRSLEKFYRKFCQLIELFEVAVLSLTTRRFLKWFPRYKKYHHINIFELSRHNTWRSILWQVSNVFELMLVDLTAPSWTLNLFHLFPLTTLLMFAHVMYTTVNIEKSWPPMTCAVTSRQKSQNIQFKAMTMLPIFISLCLHPAYILWLLMIDLYCKIKSHIFVSVMKEDSDATSDEIPLTQIAP